MRGRRRSHHGEQLKGTGRRFRFAMLPRSGVFTFRVSALQNDGDGGSSRLEFVRRKTDCNGVFAFRVLAEQKDGVGWSSRLGFVPRLHLPAVFVA